MLNICFWCRFVLIIRWFKQQYVFDFFLEYSLLVYMFIVYGFVWIKKSGINSKRGKIELLNEQGDEEDIEFLGFFRRNEKYVRCSVCRERIKDYDILLKCIYLKCFMQVYIICLFKKFFYNQVGQFILVDGKCLFCKVVVLWGDLIRVKYGCYQNLEECTSAEEDIEDVDWIDQL